MSQLHRIPIHRLIGQAMTTVYIQTCYIEAQSRHRHTHTARYRHPPLSLLGPADDGTTMPPSRFLAQSSKWRNAVATPGKPATERYEELGTSFGSGAGTTTDELNSAASLVKAGPWPLTPGSSSSGAEEPADSASVKPSALVRGAAAGSLLLLDLSQPGRKQKQVPAVQAAPGAISDFDVAPWWYGSGTELEGSLTVAAASRSSLQVTRITKPWSPESHSSNVSHSLEGKDGIGSVQWHPTVPGLLLATSGPSVAVWNATSGSSGAPAITLTLPDASPNATIRHAAWAGDASRSGTENLIGATASDGRLLLFETRSRQLAGQVGTAHASKVKASRVAFSRDARLLLTTGFSAMRQREICVWDPRSLDAAPVKKVVLTDSTSPSVLTPVIDGERNIAYLVGRGDTSVKWMELDAASQFNQGSHALGSGAEAAGGAALVPQTLCDAMQAEIDRLLVPVGGSLDGLLPLRISVPRRQLIDYHEDLFPDTVSYHSAGPDWEKTQAQKWLDGDEITPRLLSRDPSKSQYQIKQLGVEARSEAPAAAPAQAVASTPVPAAEPKKDATEPAPAAEPQGSAQSAASSPSPAAASPAAAAPASARQEPPAHEQAQPAKQNGTGPPSHIAASKTTAVPATTSRPPAAAAAKAPLSSSERPHWSRRFLAGSTPLIAAHQNLSALDTSTSPDARAFEVTPSYLFYPVAGPGGRIGFHPLAAHGRMPLSPPSIRSTSRFIEFVANPFDELSLLTASEDGMVKYWRLPPPNKVDEALKAKDQTAACTALDISEPEAAVSLPKDVASARIADIKPHPIARDIVSVVLAGTAQESQLVVLSRGSDSDHLMIQVGESGAFNHAWSPLGDLAAVACKDKKLRVVDPRKSLSAEISAHDSPRSFKIVWIDQNHLITTGHGLGSMRQIKLYRVARAEGNISLEVVKTQSLDNSPAVLFPFYDEDTNVLLLWSKGERSVSAFEVHPIPPPNVDILTALPAFQAGSPQISFAFLPKRCVNVKSIEIAAAYRLSQKEIQRVGFAFSRARPELFQDDIFVPTRDASQPLCSAKEWLSGSVGVPEAKFVSLRPEGTMALSEAPAKQTVSKLPKGPIKREQTDKEREDGLLDNVSRQA